jgi:RecG-like helicase
MLPDTLIEKLFRLTPLQKEGLKKLGLKTLGDLLMYLPSRYGEKAVLKHIDETNDGEIVVVCGKVVGTKIYKSFHTRMPMADMIVEDDTGRVTTKWFHQPYMAKKVGEGKFAKLAGIVAVKNGSRTMVNPELEEVETMELAHHGSLFGERRYTPGARLFRDERSYFSLDASRDRQSFEKSHPRTNEGRYSRGDSHKISPPLFADGTHLDSQSTKRF